MGSDLCRAHSRSYYPQGRGGLRPDFKRDLYASTEGSKASLATDVAKFANHLGGVLVLGVSDEAGEAGEAAEPTLVEISDDAELAMRQAVSARVTPFPTMDIRAVSVDGTTGYYLVHVPRSPLAPHAVRKPGSDALMYPVRDGTGTRYLSESELADRYRSRFRGEARNVSRLEVVAQEAFQPSSESGGVWLIATLVPTAPGEMRITGSTTETTRAWFNDIRRQWAIPGTAIGGSEPEPGNVRIGRQRVIVHDAAPGPPWRPPENVLIHLHTDGAGAVSTALPSWSGDPARHPLYDGLVCELPGALALLIHHATHVTGAGGDALLSVQLRDARLPVSSTQLVRSRRGETPQPIGGPPVKLPLTVETMLVPDPTAADVRELIAVTARVLDDLVTAFAVPTAEYVTPDGFIHPTRFSQLFQEQVFKWLERHPEADGRAAETGV